MYYAIVFLPLLGAIIAALIALAGARARYPGGPPDPVDASHAHGAPSAPGAHAALDVLPSEPQPQPAAGSRSAELVTTVSAFVHLYSIGYMEEDPFRPRFFSYLSLFTFAMLMLVTADNLVQLF